jgi:glucokinase
MADAALSPVGLVGDIGGTHARFALVHTAKGRPELIAPKIYLCRDFASAEQAVGAYLAQSPTDLRPGAAVLAVAGPIVDGAISLTNTDWRISEAGFRDALKLSSMRLVNDYAALALAAPILRPSDTTPIGEDRSGVPDGTIVILGAGTGFGVSALVGDGTRQAVATTEGGHISFAPVDDLDVEIWRALKARFGRVSIERILSGPGLLGLYQVMAAIEGAEATARTPDEVSRAAEAGEALAARTVDRFCATLGSVAGDFALAYGAQGGVYLAGGVSKHMLPALRSGTFRARFEAKGRFEDYLRAIPTRLIEHTHTIALLGAARALAHARSGSPTALPAT